MLFQGRQGLTGEFLARHLSLCRPPAEISLYSRPIRSVYNQWSQFEEFPRFMEGVKQVKQLDDKRLHWVAEISEKKKNGPPKSPTRFRIRR
jgi:hypothetical protein